MNEHTVNNLLNHDDDTDTINMFPIVTDFRKKFTTNFIFSHVNINSYRHKYPYVRDMLLNNSVDYLAISESKLDASFPSAQFSVDDYCLYRQDLTASSGGLIVYIRSDLPQRRLKHVECNSNGVESLCVEVTIGKRKTILSCIYKHPKVSNECFKTCFSHITDTILKTHEDIVLLGDMNCCPSKSSTVRDLCDIYGLTNLITTPTCNKGPTPTVLDVILVTNPRRYSGTLNTACELSDFHNIIGGSTKRFAPSRKPRKIVYRSYKNFSDSHFLQDIDSAPFHVGDIFDDVDDMTWFTSALITDIVNAHGPVKSKIVKGQSVPYMNSRLRKAQYSRNMTRNKYKKYGKPF